MHLNLFTSSITGFLISPFCGWWLPRDEFKWGGKLDFNERAEDFFTGFLLASCWITLSSLLWSVPCHSQFPIENEALKFVNLLYYIWHWSWCKICLSQDNASSLASRVKKTDAREIESFYQQYYEQYVRSLDQGEQADRYPSAFPPSLLLLLLVLVWFFSFSVKFWNTSVFIVPCINCILNWNFYSKFWTEPNWAKPTRRQACFLKCFALLTRPRKWRKLLPRLLPLLFYLAVLL